MKAASKIIMIAGITAFLSFSPAIQKNNLPGEADILKLPSGFSAITVAENTGRARHIAVNTNGDVFIKLGRLSNGKGILRLRDTNGDGKADDSMKFGNYEGTGIAIKNGYLYASSDEDVFRYKLNEKGDVLNPVEPEKIFPWLSSASDLEL